MVRVWRIEARLKRVVRMSSSYLIRERFGDSTRVPFPYDDSLNTRQGHVAPASRYLSAQGAHRRPHSLLSSSP